jgi:O-antigen/teichoic acid export membrane protein
MAKGLEEEGSFNIHAFSSDVLIFSFGQAVLLAFGVVQSLIIPKFLTTADYGYWQLFLLFTAYVGILHFGFLDGILVRWAGKELTDIQSDIPVAFRFLLVEQLVVVGGLILITAAISLPLQQVALLVLVYAVSMNILSFFLYTAQAIKRFKLVTAVNIGKGTLFVLLVLLLLSTDHLGYISISIAMVIASAAFILPFAISFRGNLFDAATPQKVLGRYGRENIGIGAFVLLGNFVAVLLVTVDRLAVGSFFSIIQFAQYSFAISICALGITFIQAVSLVLFPYLSGSSLETRTQAYQILRPALIVCWAIFLICYFPFTAWVSYYLPQYAESLPLIAILFCTVGFNSQIQILHVNFFKAYRMQRIYFVIAGVALAGAVILTLLAVSFFGTLVSVAVAAVVISSIWYLIDELTLRRTVSASNRDVIRWLAIIGAYAGVFLAICIWVPGWIYGMIAYTVIFLLITGTTLSAEMANLIRLIKTVVSQVVSARSVQP